jgi:hypothetical protein
MDALTAGTHVVVDRYAYSGVAFSSGALPSLQCNTILGPGCVTKAMCSQARVRYRVV